LLEEEEGKRSKRLNTAKKGVERKEGKNRKVQGRILPLQGKKKKRKELSYLNPSIPREGGI